MGELPDFPVERAKFAEVRAALMAEFPGQYVVIVGDKVVGVYEEIEDAFDAGFRAADGPNFFNATLTDEVHRVTRLTFR